MNPLIGIKKKRNTQTFSIGKTILTLSLPLLVITACQTVAQQKEIYQNYLDTLQGKSLDEIKTLYGEPKSDEWQADGGRVVTYHSSEEKHIPAHCIQIPRQVPSGTKPTPNGGRTTAYKTVYDRQCQPARDIILSCNTNFTFDKNNILIASQFEGNDCKPIE